MFTFLKNIFSKKEIDYPTLLKQGALIVDVRSPKEFQSGHAKGAINIPLGEIKNRLSELKQNKPVITCCRSGARSGRATKLLIDADIETHNGGSWQAVNAAIVNR